jgi:DNA-binding transcriptional MocR family regulator
MSKKTNQARSSAAQSTVKGRKPTRYEQVAQRVSKLIDKGVLKPGDRVPSIRKMSAQAGVAVSTVIEAYRLLEDRGLVESRPQSGYFVKPSHMRGMMAPSAPPEPELQSVPLRAGLVRSEDSLTRHMNIDQDSKIIQLGAGLPSAEFLPTALLNRILAREVRTHPAKANRYELTPGLAELRTQIARRMMNGGCSLGPDDIVITSGATEAMALALRAVTQPGDTVAVESPCYYGLLFLLRSLQLRAVEVGTCPRSGISINALEQLLASKSEVKALVINPNVHNPLGCIMPDDNKRHIAELFAANQIPIIEDDTYADLAFDTARPHCVHSFDKRENVMLCGSFSKTLSPGFRVGWIAASRWREAVHGMKLATSLGCATPMQMAVAKFLATGGFDHHLRRLRRTYQEQLSLLSHTVFHSFPAGTRATRPAGGHVLWIELPTTIDARELEDHALAKGIAIAPGPLFSVRGRYTNYLRLNAALSWTPEIEAAVKKVGRLAEKIESTAKLGSGRSRKSKGTGTTAKN